MTKGLRYRLSAAEKDALFDDRAALIEAMAELVARLSAPRKTSKSSHLSPSSGPKANGPGKGGKRKPRPSRAEPPAGMAPGTPFGPNIHAL
ncbi:MAG: hypothetical protein AAFU49_06600, partial [Pseudomonadota bacterium]